MNNILTVNSVPRSKLMSEILQKTGLVERSGQGVDKLYYCDVLSCVCDCLLTITKKSNNLIEPAVSSAVLRQVHNQ